MSARIGSTVSLHPPGYKPTHGWQVIGRRDGRVIVRHPGTFNGRVGVSMSVDPSIVRMANPASVAQMRGAYERFHWGTKARGGYAARLPSGARRGFEIGKLHAVELGGTEYKTRYPEPRLVSDSGGRLAIVGRLIGVPAGSYAFTAVAYSTHKRGEGRHTWHHKFGEDGGHPPTLHVSRTGYISITGGSYVIRPEGIVN